MSLPIPSEKVQERAKKVIDEFVEYAETKRDEKIAYIDELYNNYMVKWTGGKYPGRAQNVDSFSHEAVETIVPRIFEVLTQNGQLKYEVSPVGIEDEPLTERANALIAHDLKKAKGRKKVLEGIRYIAKYGTGVFFTPWVKEVRRRLTPKYSIKGVRYEGDMPVYQEVLDGYEVVDTPIHEGVGLELVDLRSCYLDPFEPDVQKAQAIIHEQNIAFEELEKEELKRKLEYFNETDQFGTSRRAAVERVVGHYFNLKELKEKLATGTSIKEEVAGETQTREQTALTPMKKAKVKHYYGRFDKGDGKDAEYIIAIAEDDLVIRCDVTDLPERPYLVCRYIPVENQTYGLGILEILRTSQSISSDILNQYVDNATMILCNMWKRRAGSGVTDDMLEFTPFGVIDLEDMDDLMPLEMNHVTGTAIEALQYSHERQREAVGAYHILTATPMSYDQTATEISTMSKEALARIVMGAINIEDEFISPYLQRVIEYNYHFMGPEKLVRITNDEGDSQGFQGVTASDLAHQWDYTPMGARNFQRKMQRRQDFQSFIADIANLTSINPQVFMQLTDMGIEFAPLILGIAKTYDIPELDDAIKKVKSGQIPQNGEAQGQDQITAAIQQIIGAGNAR